MPVAGKHARQPRGARRRQSAAWRHECSAFWDGRVRWRLPPRTGPLYYLQLRSCTRHPGTVPIIPHTALIAGNPPAGWLRDMGAACKAGPRRQNATIPTLDHLLAGPSRRCFAIAARASCACKPAPMLLKVALPALSSLYLKRLYTKSRSVLISGSIARFAVIVSCKFAYVSAERRLCADTEPVASSRRCNLHGTRAYRSLTEVCMAQQRCDVRFLLRGQYLQQFCLRRQLLQLSRQRMSRRNLISHELIDSTSFEYCNSRFGSPQVTAGADGLHFVTQRRQSRVASNSNVALSTVHANAPAALSSQPFLSLTYLSHAFETGASGQLKTWPPLPALTAIFASTSEHRSVGRPCMTSVHLC
jgi:hypothetical protein